MASPIDSPAEAQKLRRSLHEKIDQVLPVQLPSLSETVQEWELRQLRRQLNVDFDADHASGKLADDKVCKATALHRARRPYR